MRNKVWNILSKCIGGLALGLGLSLLAVSPVLADSVSQENLSGDIAADAEIPAAIDVDGYHYVYSEVNEAYMFMSYDGESTIVEIPATINDVRVLIERPAEYGLADPFTTSSAAQVTSLTIHCEMSNASFFALDMSGWTSLQNLTTYGKMNSEVRLPSSLQTLKILGGCIKLPSVSGFAALRTVEISSCDSKTVEYSQFDGCTALSKVVLPADITTIKNYAFSNTGLTSLTIPASVTDLEYYSIVKNTKLTSLTINCKIATEYRMRLDSNSKLTTVVLNGMVTTHPYFPSTLTTLKMLGGCSTYPYLSECSKLKTVQIAKCTATTLPSFNFYNCSALTSVTLPSNLKVISQYAFYGTSALKTLTLPSSLTTIGEMAFEYSGLTALTVPSNVTTIGRWAFLDCKALKTIKLSGTKLTTIGQQAFGGCSALTKITIPSSVKKLEPYTFNGATALYQVVLTSGTTTIDSAAFYGATCTRLTIVAPSSSVAAKFAKEHGIKTTTTASLKVDQGVPKTFVGGKLELVVYNSPSKITYATSNKSIATISSAGVITAKKAGTVTISATINGKKYSYKYTIVTRTQANVTSIIYNYYVKSTMTDYEKIMAADAWIVKNVQYDYANYKKGTIPSISHTAKGAFEKGVAVCDGYAYAFQIIMKHYGISCNVVYGTANGGGHAWNEVLLGSYWYQVDVCWDDPIINGSAANTVSTKSYLLITNAQMAKNHSWNQSSYHKATKTTFNKQINHTGYKGAVINYMKPSVAVKATTTLKVTGTKEKVTFSSADTSIAKVSSKGVITGVKKGSTIITVKIGTKSYKVTVTVK